MDDNSESQRTIKHNAHQLAIEARARRVEKHKKFQSTNVQRSRIRPITNENSARYMSRQRSNRISIVSDNTPLNDITNVNRSIQDPQTSSSSGKISALPHYHDNGDPTYNCRYCNARMWFDERLAKHYNDSNPSFGMCCLQGKIKLPPIEEPPTELKSLLSGSNSTTRRFRTNVRIYNSMFAFTSMGGKVDRDINNGRGPYVFRMGGQNMHMIGSILPPDGMPPRFAQLYIYDTGNEIANRLSAVSVYDAMSSQVDKNIVQTLQIMLDRDNTLVQTFRMARDFVNTNEGQEIKIKLVHKRGRDTRQYNMPSAQNEVAALIVGDIGDADCGRDIVVKYKSGLLHRITETHPDFLPLQYPLLYPFGRGGYKEGIPHMRLEGILCGNSKTVTMREYFAYIIQSRQNEFSTILRGGKLFQQFIVDAYMMIESYRILWIRTHQKQLRAEIYRGLTDAVLVGETNASARGMRIILPSSFTGGARYTLGNYQDAMVICMWAGYPDLFITFTCNPKWPEITRELGEHDQKLEDRPDIISRVFEMKLHLLMKDLRERQLFGVVKAVLYTIEFQKRGLPHAHIILFLDSDYKLIAPSDVDAIISAEIPNQEDNPLLYDAVGNFMMHGPCGILNPNSPCMSNGECTKYYPRRFNSSTVIHEDGYPHYKRRNDGHEIMKNGIPLDNRSVIPYNPYLLLKYQAHINVERCKEGGPVKYLFKYVSKGHDRATAAFYEESSSSGSEVVHDEIKMYYDVRYLSSCEAVWRIFGFDINYRTPSVERLSFHLPNHQTVIYEDDEGLDDVVTRVTGKQSKFLAWMEANKSLKDARLLTYAEFPTKFVWKKKSNEWQPRQSGTSIGRICYVPPGIGEAFYLRLLLGIVKGPRSYKEIRTVDGVHYETFRDACYALGLLDDDKEYIDALQDSSHWASPDFLRRLFCTLLFCNCIARPEIVWQQTWKLMADDIIYRQQQQTGHPCLNLNEEELHNSVLVEIENLLKENGRSLEDYDSMPCPDVTSVSLRGNRYLHNELNFDREALHDSLKPLVANLTAEQKEIYDTVITAVNCLRGGLYFVYGHGGTGKTYLWQTLSTSLRADGKVVLNVASSGIASLLLPNGKTAHSQFVIPLTVTEDSMCNIKQGSQLAELLLHVSLVIWDEAPMAHKHCFEALDRTMRDIISRSCPEACSKPFGGKVILLGGDFRQILPVIPRGSREDIVYATINASYLWRECKLFTLTKNMRLMSSESTANNKEVQEFSKWIISIGDGSIPTDDDSEHLITIPNEYLLEPDTTPLECIVGSIYPDLMHHLNDKQYFKDRAILGSTLSVVDDINNYILDLIPTDERVYLSADSVSKQDRAHTSIEDIHSVEFLNTISMSGLPNHKLKLKVGVPIMLMRNIDKSNGLCNGSRLIVTRLEQHVIGAELMTSNGAIDNVLIPRVTITPTGTSLPFTLCRRQFPVMLSFAMTINKSQGQSLHTVGLYLPRPVFTHGQLYVALSRVRSKEGLKILILDQDGNATNKTCNIVYKEVFCNLVN